MQKVLPGQKLSISADDWNIIAEMVRDYRASILSGGAGAALPVGDSAVILAKNASGQDLNRFSVVVITGVVFGPDDNLEEYLNRPTYTFEVLGGGE